LDVLPEPSKVPLISFVVQWLVVALRVEMPPSKGIENLRDANIGNEQRGFLVKNLLFKNVLDGLSYGFVAFYINVNHGTFVEKVG
jgi:hypothetical protein